MSRAGCSAREPGTPSISWPITARESPQLAQVTHIRFLSTRTLTRQLPVKRACHRFFQAQSFQRVRSIERWTECAREWCRDFWRACQSLAALAARVYCLSADITCADLQGIFRVYLPYLQGRYPRISTLLTVLLKISIATAAVFESIKDLFPNSNDRLLHPGRYTALVGGLDVAGTLPSHQLSAAAQTGGKLNTLGRTASASENIP